MRSQVSEIIDRALTNDLERYIKMEIEEVCEAIIVEWPRQIGIMILEFLLSTGCTECGETPDFIRFKRKEGNGNYIAPVCKCERRGA